MYDDLGRLKAVIDPATDTAVYNYDAVGNLLSISRQSSSTVSILEFTPKSGPVESIVTIYGIGFNTTPSQNTVQFNGVAAAVSASTETRIVTTAPSGATTGAIGVTTPMGSATSAVPFTVAPSGAPTITGFSPSIGVPGTSVNITGTNFDSVSSRNVVRFNTPATVTSAASTNLNATVPTAAASGRVSLATVLGTAVSSADFYIPPSPYTASDVQHTGRMAIGGPSHTVVLSTANKIALVVFDGAPGQRVSLVVNSSTFANCGSGIGTKILNPDGTTLATTTLCTGTIIEPVTLPASATYTMVADPWATATGQVVYALYGVVDVTGTITIGGPAVTAVIPTPGQKANLTFSGTSGQRVSLVVNSSTFANCGSGIGTKILNPDGTTLASSNLCAGTIIEPVTLPVSGTYSLFVDPYTTATGQVTYTLHNVVDVTGTVSIGGSPLPVTITTPGQKALLTFAGTVSQQVTVRITSNTMGSTTVKLNKPDGTQLTSSTSGASNFNLTTQTLPSGGTYTIIVDPSSTNTGSANVSVTSP